MNISIVYPKLKYQSKVNDVIGHLNPRTMEDTLTVLTSYFNRYYKSDYGAQSSHWIYLQVSDVCQSNKLPQNYS